MALSGQLQHRAMVAILATAWLLAAINPLDRGDWLLENLLVFAAFIILGLTYRIYRFSDTSYWLFTVFMCLHLYGSHYTYAETPLGYWFKELLDLPRNHYDRVVHFSFGLLLAYPFRELLRDKAGLSGRWLTLMTLSIILSYSAIYELMEMLAAVIVEPELGSAFLGTQGDEWDAQKDTALAFLGGCLAMVISPTARLARG